MQLQPSIQKVANVNRWICLLVLLAILITGLIYSKGLNGTFILDDETNLRPTFIKEFTWENLELATVSNSSGIFKRPVAALSFALTSLAHGNGPWGFKYHNLLIHLLSGVLVFIFSRQLFTINHRENDLIRIYGPAFVGCLWLLHPLHVSTVLYAVQRMTQLSAIFSLLAMIIFLKARLSTKGIKKSILYFTGFPLSFALAILSKENAALLPLYLLLLYFLIRRANSRQINSETTSDRLFINLFGFTPILAGLFLFAIKRHSILDYSTRSFDMTERVLSQIGFLCLYLQQLMLPRLAKMGLYFDDVPIPSEFSGILIAQLVFLSLLILFGLTQLIKGKLLGFAILFFFAGHALESTILPLELAFEHRNYLPSVGIIIATAILGANLVNKKRTLIGLIFVFFTIWISILYIRVNFWSDLENWQKTTLSFHPKSERTQINFLHTLRMTGDSDLLIEQSKKAMQTLPNKISLKFQYLVNTCHIETMSDDRQSTIIDIEEHLKSNNLSVIGFNNLAVLVSFIANKKCYSIQHSEIESILSIAIYSQPNEISRKTEANLWFLKGLLASSVSMSLEASEHFRRGYLLISDYRYKTAEIKSLLFIPETRDVGIEVLRHELTKTSSLPLSSRLELQEIKLKVDDFLENNSQIKFAY